VQVTTFYPGASAEIVAQTVALPLEQQVNGVEGMLYMQSTSASNGSYTLTITFAIGTNLDLAQVLVQNRVATALPLLPTAVNALGVTVQKTSTSFLQIAALYSPDNRFDSLFLSNYATINLVPELQRLPGVGSVTVYGAGLYSMRVWLDPNKLYTYGLVPQDVIGAIQNQNRQVSAGQVGSPPAPPEQSFQLNIKILGRLDDVAQFGEIIVKADPGSGGRLVRLSDIARIELGAQSYAQQFHLDGKSSAGIAIFQTPEATRSTSPNASATGWQSCRRVSRQASATESPSTPRAISRSRSPRSIRRWPWPASWCWWSWCCSCRTGESCWFRRRPFQ
jgi:HAE1 family hydrophobic/amphiphilic exporter-1